MVNFANDGGFAIIAADRNCDDVLAVTESGHYDPEAGTDNPGLQIFMERAVGYASEMAERNSVAASPIETLPTPQGIELTQHKELLLSGKKRQNHIFSTNIISYTCFTKKGLSFEAM